ncbi:hypothetical protein [Lentibacillus sp. Marseille-P4043]|uniref:hypothetical protein n=1 Tax=Lentibacillus sp. Marseille-P4043 TaxID=2040293 RepID=UPI001F17EA60|nr:hypothetical protein [Lentibacillus sp. Marseille-P4043]
MDKKKSFEFEEIFEQNKRRIHYHIHKLNIRDPHREYFQEGLCALWNACEIINQIKAQWLHTSTSRFVNV